MSRAQREYASALRDVLGTEPPRVALKPRPTSAGRPFVESTETPLVRPSQMGALEQTDLPRRPSVTDFLKASSATAAPAASVPAVATTKPSAMDFLGALDGITVAASPVKGATPIRAPDPATASALAALRGYSEVDYMAPTGSTVIAAKGRSKLKLMAARDTADQLLIDRVSAAEAKAEHAAQAAQKYSRQLASLRSKILRLEEERDKARDFVAIAQEEASQLRADNLALHSKSTQQLASWEDERATLKSENTRLRAEVERLITEQRSAVPSWERERAPSTQRGPMTEMERLAAEFEEESRERKKNRELATVLQAAERGRQMRQDLSREPHSANGPRSPFDYPPVSSPGRPLAAPADRDVGVSIVADAGGRHKISLSLAGEDVARTHADETMLGNRRLHDSNRTEGSGPRRSYVRLDFVGGDCVASIGLRATELPAALSPARADDEVRANQERDVSAFLRASSTAQLGAPAAGSDRIDSRLLEAPSSPHRRFAPTSSETGRPRSAIHELIASPAAAQPPSLASPTGRAQRDEPSAASRFALERDRSNRERLERDPLGRDAPLRDRFELDAFEHHRPEAERTDRAVSAADFLRSTSPGRARSGAQDRLLQRDALPVRGPSAAGFLDAINEQEAAACDLQRSRERLVRASPPGSPEANRERACTGSRPSSCERVRNGSPILSRPAPASAAGFMQSIAGPNEAPEYKAPSRPSVEDFLSRGESRASASRPSSHGVTRPGSSKPILSLSRAPAARA